MLKAENQAHLSRAPVACLTMTIGDRIREAREAAGISKSGLGRAVGVSASAITQWESGETKTLEAVNLIRAARALNVMAEWLATGKGPRALDQAPGAAAIADSPGALSAREEILIELFRGLFKLQQTELVHNMRALFLANQMTRKELGQAELRGVSNERIEAIFGDASKPIAASRKRPSGPSGTRAAGDDFMGGQ